MYADKHILLATIDENERPVSLRVLGAYSEKLGIKTTILVILKKLAEIGRPVTFTRKEISQIIALLNRDNVTHLGFYLMTGSLKPYAALVKALRESGYKGIIMAGGVHPTLCPAESLVDGADYAVQGPGEVPLEMLFKGSDPVLIPGLVWRKDGKINVNSQQPSQKLDLDSLPFPIFRLDKDWILADGRIKRLNWRRHEKYASWNGRYYDMITSRGCVYKCSYCCNVNGAPVRRSGVDHVISELKALREKEPRIRGVNIQDDNFCSGSDQWVKEFCSRMKNEVGLPFIVRMIPRFVTRERMEILKSGGLQYVTMGLEASDRLNKQLFDRNENAKSFLKAADIIQDAGFYLSTDILINNPYEREEDLRDVALTLNSLRRPNWGVVALSLTPFPNTGLYTRCVRDKMLSKFSTDAYDAMLMPSKPGGYLTPRFWLLLNTQILPNVPREIGERLINGGPGDLKTVKTVESLAAYIRVTKKCTGWLQSRLPGLYSMLGLLLKRK